MAKIDFEKLYRLQMVTMKLNVCHPETKYDKKWISYNIISHGIYLLDFFLLSNAIMFDMGNKDYFKAFRNGVPAIIFICLMFNYFLFLKHSKTITKLIKCMKDDYHQRTLDIKFEKIVLDYIDKSTWIMNRWFIVMTTAFFVFLIKCITISIYYLIIGDYHFISFHEMHYPEFVEKRKHENVFVYGICFVLEALFTLKSSMLFACSLPLGPIFMLHVCGLLEQIKVKFENVFEKEDVEDRLNDIVKDLQHVYRFVADVNKCFKLMYEVMLKQTTFLVPITAYAIVKSISYGEVTIEYFSVLFALFLMTTPCYYSDLLMSKGEEVRQAAYASGWERVHIPRARKTLLLILIMVLKPVSIKAIFCTIDLDTLANAYRQAYTIFNLLCAMYG